MSQTIELGEFYKIWGSLEGLRKFELALLTIPGSKWVPKGDFRRKIWPKMFIFVNEKGFISARVGPNELIIVSFDRNR
mgnify:CR=1 FL=1